MNLTVNVFYPKPIDVSDGETIQVEGIVTERWTISAWRITRVGPGPAFQIPRAEMEPVAEYPGERPFMMPLVGTVVGSLVYGDVTHIQVLPTAQTIHDFHRIGMEQARISVPAFWNLIDARQEFSRRFIPSGQKLWDGEQRRPVPPKLGFFVQSLRDLASVDDLFETKRRPLELDVWGGAEKIVQLRRHLERIRMIDDVRRHLYACEDSAGRLFLLREASFEVTLIVEAAAVVAYSSLDVFSHAINEVYGLGQSKSNCRFMSVLGTGDEANTQSVRSLRSDFPDDPLTKFLIVERGSWIPELERVRHYIVHRGSLTPAEHVHGRSAITLSVHGDADEWTTEGQWIAEDLLLEWVERLEKLMIESCKIMDARVRWLKGQRANNPIVRETPSPQSANAPRQILDFIKLWSSDSSEERISRMYARLHANWKKEWSLAQFSKYIEFHKVEKVFAIGSSTSSPNKLGGNTHISSFRFSGKGKTWIQHFASEKPLGKRPMLIRTALSTPPALAENVIITKYHVRQSDVSSGYRDLWFEVEVSNISEHDLENLSVHIFERDHEWSVGVVGSIQKGDSVQSTITLVNGCVPIGEGYPAPSATILWDPIEVKIIYKVESEFGQYWAESFKVSNKGGVARIALRDP